MRLPTSISRRSALTILCVLAAVPLARAGSLLETIDREVSSLYEKSQDAIVKIHATHQVSAIGIPRQPPHRIGTGFFIDGEGRLLTVAAVVNDADRCWIEWRGKRIDAEVLGIDPATNLAMLRIDPMLAVEPGNKLPYLVLGNSDDVRIGSMVIAIGFPFDLPSAPSVGFVSGLDIQSGGRVFVTSHIRAGCKLSPGQGGGPLLNSSGEVVGIAVAAHSGDQAYALPVNAAKKVVNDFLTCGQPCHGWVGLNVGQRRRIQPEGTADDTQVVVQQVYSNTPAAVAGFHNEDLLIAIQTNNVRRLADVLNTMFYYKAGDHVEFTILRGGNLTNITLIVGQRPVEEDQTTATAVVAPPANRPAALPSVTPVSGER